MLNSEYVHFLKKWEFQDDIPTLYSELSVTIVRGVDYRTLLTGLQLTSKYRKIKAGSSWSLENIPAIKEEPYCPNIEDYAETISFQLAGYEGATGYVDVYKDWAAIPEELFDIPHYRLYFRKHKNVKPLLNHIITKEENDIEKAKKIYNYVIQNFKWNKRYGLIPDEQR